MSRRDRAATNSVIQQKSFRQRSQGKPARHGRQFLSAPQTVCAEFSFEDSSDRRNEGGTASQEDAIDVAGLDMASLKQSIDTVFDSADRRFNPGLEIEPANFLPDLDRRVFEEKEAHPIVREFHFGPFCRPIEFVPEIVPDDMQQGIDLLRLQRLWFDLSQQGSGLMIFQKRYVMPTA